MTESIGLLAATCTTVAFLPQVLHVWRTRSAEDISLGMYIVFCSGVALWLIYGLLIQSAPLLLANGLTLVLATCVLAMKLAWGRGRLSRAPRAPRDRPRAPRSRRAARSESSATPP